ncbi:hypothetical protein [Chromobacterium vaccinii]|uniref:hypothetical protein n=1 Tax=Chromobacterium vaccinii TaxID=1108595 RepID=UPI000A9E25AB|nr:hypothetical protein [Chromobacterium vaccinii]
MAMNLSIGVKPHFLRFYAANKGKKEGPACKCPSHILGRGMAAARKGAFLSDFPWIIMFEIVWLSFECRVCGMESQGA